MDHLMNPPPLMQGSLHIPHQPKIYIPNRKHIMEFVVAKSTSSKNGGFVNTITHDAEVKHESLGTIFRKKRFCVKTKEALTIGQTVDLDLSKFEIATLESQVTDENGEIITISTNWLFLV